MTEGVAYTVRVFAIATLLGFACGLFATGVLLRLRRPDSRPPIYFYLEPVPEAPPAGAIPNERPS